MVSRVINLPGNNLTALMSGRFGNTRTQVTAKFMEFLGDLELVTAQLMSHCVVRVETADETILI
jgi:hypothetical protein